MNFVKEIKTTFSNKMKAADTEWKIESFKQGKRNTVDFMIEFKALAIKTDTNKLHMIFLLKKNVLPDIIKTILGYSLIVALETLKEWKVAITSVEQGYESTERQYDYKTGTGTTYREQGQPMDIRKSNGNFKDKKLQCFNCNKYKHMAKKCWKKKEKDIRKCFKCKKMGHIMKDCKEKQPMKKQSIQEESDDKDNEDKQKDFEEDPKQVQYKRSL